MSWGGSKLIDPMQEFVFRWRLGNAPVLMDRFWDLTNPRLPLLTLNEGFTGHSIFCPITDLLGLQLPRH